jgi:hypothetical protein
MVETNVTEISGISILFSLIFYIPVVEQALNVGQVNVVSGGIKSEERFWL